MNDSTESCVIASQCTWDQYFMTMAYLVSMRSKDPSTRVGAVIAGPEHEVRSTGYNGLPPKISDIADRYENIEYKRIALNHAEENAILHCARIGISTKGCTIYSMWQPCALCAKMIIQTGIKRVVFDVNFPGNNEFMQKDWVYSMQVALEMLNEAEVEVCGIDKELVRIEGLYKSSRFSPFSAYKKI